MPSYNFQSRFADLVARGIKRSTIRARRRDRRDAKPGQTLYLFTGQRTKNCRRLLETRCESVRSIYISSSGNVYIQGRRLSPRGQNEIAKADGFTGAGDMVLWFHKYRGLPFSGILIKW